MIPYPARKAVERALDTLGYWYPPDLVVAVAEGRSTYRPIDTALEWAVTPYQREVIGRLLDLEWPTWREAAA